MLSFGESLWFNSQLNEVNHSYGWEASDGPKLVLLLTRAPIYFVMMVLIMSAINVYV